MGEDPGGRIGSRIVGLLGAIVMSVLGGIVDSRVQAGEISVAAASDMNFAFKEIDAEFEEKTGNTVRLSLGSSGDFFAQISNGAPFDLYFSAEISYPTELEGAGLAEPGSYGEVPIEAYPRLEQGAMVLKAAKDVKTARAFLDFIKGPDGTAVLKRYGFFLPSKTVP